MITETLREHEDGTGFTLTTLDPKSAFAMAEKMAFSGKKYSIKLSGVKDGEWTVIASEVEIARKKALYERPNRIDAPIGATHLIIKRTEPAKGSYDWAFYDGKDFKIHPDKPFCFHPDGYDIVETLK